MAEVRSPTMSVVRAALLVVLLDGEGNSAELHPKVVSLLSPAYSPPTLSEVCTGLATLDAQHRIERTPDGVTLAEEGGRDFINNHIRRERAETLSRLALVRSLASGGYV